MSHRHYPRRTAPDHSPIVPARDGRNVSGRPGVPGVVESAWIPCGSPAVPTLLTVVTQRTDEGRLVEQHRWGLVPSFAKTLKEGAKRINARAETVATSPSFRSSFRKRRCIVPSDGFYEWQRTGGPKQPYFLHPPERAVLAMAGVWAVWKDPETGLWVPSAAVITTQANRMMSSIHDRMPVLLPREAWDDWLDPELDDREYLRSLLRAPPGDESWRWSRSRPGSTTWSPGTRLIEPAPRHWRWARVTTRPSRRAVGLDRERTGRVCRRGGYQVAEDENS